MRSASPRPQYSLVLPGGSGILSLADPDSKLEMVEPLLHPPLSSHVAPTLSPSGGRSTPGRTEVVRSHLLPAFILRETHNLMEKEASLEGWKPRLAELDLPPPCHSPHAPILQKS